MDLSNLTKITTKEKRRLGQGHGSGRVKTSGRGTKGQKARGRIPIHFEGGALPLIKRLPFLRGKGKNKSFKKKPIIVNIKVLNLFAKGSTVDVAALIEKKIVAGEAKQLGVKLLGDGEITLPLTVKLQMTKSAAEKIQKAGGTVVTA